MRLVISSEVPPAKPCLPKCKKGTVCVHAGPEGPGVTPYGQPGTCVPLKTCKKPVCKKPKMCDEITGHCVTPPPPPPQSCLGPIAATITRMPANASDPNAVLQAVWQPSGKPGKVSMCRAVSLDSGKTWHFDHTVDNGKDALSSVHSFGISPKVAFAPTATAGSPDGDGIVVMTQGRASALGAGLSLWVSRVSHDPHKLSTITMSDSWFNLASLHNDGVALNATELEFTDGFVDGHVDPGEGGSSTAVRLLRSNASHMELIALYVKNQGEFLPNWYEHIGYPVKVVQNDSILFAMHLTVSLVAPPPPKPTNQLQYLTWYDSFSDEQINMTAPGPNLIWHSGNVSVLHAQATQLGVSAMWAFNEYCSRGFRIFDNPYCGEERLECMANSTKYQSSCPFGKACPTDGKACPKPGGPCRCPYPPAQLALNWTTSVQNVAALLTDKPRIVGLWMGGELNSPPLLQLRRNRGITLMRPCPLSPRVITALLTLPRIVTDEPEIGGMSGDSLCAVAAEMKRALHRVGRNDIFIMYNDGPSSVRFREGLCRGLDYFSIDSYDTGAAEANEVAGLYKRALVPKLRGPNKWERRGQGLWFVPGLYATCTGPVLPVPRYPFGNQSLNRTEPTCKGAKLSKSPADVLAKMEAFWKYAQDPAYAIVGINPW